MSNEETLYIIEKHYSLQHSDEYKIVLISKNKEYAEEKYKECLRLQDRINTSEEYDYTVKYSFNAYPENYVNELNIFEPWEISKLLYNFLKKTLEKFVSYRKFFFLCIK